MIVDLPSVQPGAILSYQKKTGRVGRPKRPVDVVVVSSGDYGVIVKLPGDKLTTVKLEDLSHKQQ